MLFFFKDEEEGDYDIKGDTKTDNTKGSGDKVDKEEDKSDEATTTADKSDRTPRSSKNANKQESRTKKGADPTSKEGRK